MYVHIHQKNLESSLFFPSRYCYHSSSFWLRIVHVGFCLLTVSYNALLAEFKKVIFEVIDHMLKTVKKCCLPDSSLVAYIAYCRKM